MIYSKFDIKRILDEFAKLAKQWKREGGPDICTNQTLELIEKIEKSL